MTNLFPDKALDVGTMIADRYRVERVLGSGGMGFVYLTADRLLGEEKIAVKVLHEGYADDKVQTARFLREVQLMRKVNHKNVVRTYDVGADGTQVYFTMEYVPGRQLEEIIGDHGMAVDEIPGYLVQICEGLQAIHSAGIIHRDLKPGNILVLADRTLRITDFGVARPEVSTLTAHDEIVGSVCYMAPEMWLGQQLTPAVDLYALGVILYEMCTGNVPFDGDSPGVLMRLHLDREPVPPRDRNTRIPPWLNKLVLRLLAKSPSERPRDPREVIDYVRTHAGSASIGPSSAESGKAAAAQFFNELESGLSKRQTAHHEERRNVTAEEGKVDHGQRVRRRTLGGRGVDRKTLQGEIGLETGKAGTEHAKAHHWIWLLIIGVWTIVCLTVDLVFPPLVEMIGFSAAPQEWWSRIQTAVGANTSASFWQYSVVRSAGVYVQLCLPLMVLGLVLPSTHAALRLFGRGLLFLVVAGIVLLSYFLSALPDTKELNAPSVVAAAITVKDQLSTVAVLSPAINVYEQVKLGDGLVQDAVGCLPITRAPFVLALQFVFVFVILYATGGAKALIGAVLVAVLILLESLMVAFDQPLLWYQSFGLNQPLGISVRLPAEAFLVGAVNWLVLGAWLRRVTRPRN